MRIAIIGALLLAAPGLGGCLSICASDTQVLTISAGDPEAEIFVDGNKVGLGCVTLEVKRDQPHRILARKGNLAAGAFVGLRVSDVGWWDVALSPLLLFLPLWANLCPGFWALDREEIHLHVQGK